MLAFVSGVLLSLAIHAAGLFAAAWLDGRVARWGVLVFSRGRRGRGLACQP